MLKLGFDKLNLDGINKSANAWYNLTLSVNIKNYELVSSSAYSWLKANSSKKPSDLEDKLRSDGINAYLIAKPSLPLEIDGEKIELKYINTIDETIPEYELDYKCISKIDLDVEFTRENTNYAENYNNLNKSGIYILTDNLSDGEVINTGDVTTMVHHNLVKLKILNLSQEEVNYEMNQDIEKAKIETGEDSSAQPIGQSKDGSVVLAHFVNGKVISQYGLMVCNNNEGKEVIKIILVTDKNTWV